MTMLEDRLARVGSVAVRGLQVFAVLFLLLPLVVAAHQAFLPTVAFELLPSGGFTFRWFGVLARAEFLHAVGVSLLIAVVATAVSLVCGTLAALARQSLSRRHGAGGDDGSGGGRIRRSRLRASAARRVHGAATLCQTSRMRRSFRSTVRGTQPSRAAISSLLAPSIFARAMAASSPL